jgi:hypothetical protein
MHVISHGSKFTTVDPVPTELYGACITCGCAFGCAKVKAFPASAAKAGFWANCPECAATVELQEKPVKA